MGLILAFCLFLKRKDEDMLPYKVQPKDPEGDAIAEKEALALVVAERKRRNEKAKKPMH
jgi:hypothetical protein